MDENQKMQKITKLLEKGGTMLAASHDCGAPMFRYQGKVLCPVCDSADEKMKEGAGIAGTAGKPVRKESILDIPSGMEGGSSQIAAMTEKKIQEIAGSLESETDLHRIREKMECIELGIRILKLLAGKQDDERGT